MTIILTVAGATFVSGVVAYVLQIVMQDMRIEILAFLRIIGIEVFYNIMISIIMYPLLQRAGAAVENAFSEQKILTRQF